MSTVRTLSGNHTIKNRRLRPPQHRFFPGRKIIRMETEAIVEQIRSLLSELRAKGISEDAIDSLLGQRADQRIVVDGRGYLQLPDCRNVKVRLTPMERTLYIFLLRYPEGIPVDDLYLYYDELLKIYSSQTVYDDAEAAKEAVGALVDDCKTTLYTNVSRIKKKLVDKLGAKVAAPLLITRTDGIYRIPVERRLVSYR